MPLTIPTTFREVLVTRQAKDVAIFKDGWFPFQNIADLGVIDDSVHHTDEHVAMLSKLLVLIPKFFPEVYKVSRSQWPSLIFAIRIGFCCEFKLSQEMLINIFKRNGVRKNDVKIYPAIPVFRVSNDDRSA